MRRGTSYYASIDYLRFVCAIFVVLFHLAYSSTRGSLTRLVITPGLDIPEGTWFRYGWVGVQIFFVISGFVIAESAASASPWSFLRRRLERLYPAVWICAPLSALVWITHGRDVATTLALLVKSLALVPGGEWIDAPYWTLGCEIGFYAVVFLVLAAVGGARLDRLALGLTLVSAVFWLLHAVETLSGVSTGVGIFAALKPIPIYYGMYFALGMLLYFRKSGRAVAYSGPAIALCLALACVESSLVLHNPAGPFWGPVLLYLAGVAVIAAARPSGHVNATARMCGLVTYPLYLVHFASGLVVLEAVRATGVPGFAAALVAAAAMTGLAAVIAVYLEPRLRILLRRALDGVEPVLSRRGPGWLFAQGLPKP